MRPIRQFFAFLAGALIASAAFAQQDFSMVEIKTERLSPTTYVLFGSGGNIGVSVGEDALFLIDDQYAPLTPKILDALKALTDKPVKFLINTHHHFDHTGGNQNMGKVGAIIVAHDNVRKRLSTEQFVKAFNARTPAQPKEALPVVTFSADTTFHLNGDEINVFHVPKAHTDGDSIVHFRKSNVIHMGDCYFNGFYPFIDTSGGGHPDGMIAAHDRVLAMADDNTKIIPGHGPISDKKTLKANRDMLATVWGRVQKLAKEGKSLDDIVAAKPTADFEEKFGKGFFPAARFIEVLHSAVK
jgi:glyoxylase-like metal-dependent hydrolase (beta-lactamase superfamily II)